MKKSYALVIFFVLCVLGSLPMLSIVKYHIQTVQQWQHINHRILELKIKKDEQQKLLIENKKLTTLKPPFSLDVFNQTCRSIPLLQNEIHKLQNIPEASLLSCDPKILSRRKALAMMPKLSWVALSSNTSPYHIKFSHVMEMETEDLVALLNLFNAPNAPLGFFSYLEIQKQVAPLDHHVWHVQAEALCY